MRPTTAAILISGDRVNRNVHPPFFYYHIYYLFVIRSFIMQEHRRNVRAQKTRELALSPRNKLTRRAHETHGVFLTRAL